MDERLPAEDPDMPPLWYVLHFLCFLCLPTYTRLVFAGATGPMTASDMNPKWIMHNATHDFIAHSEQQERKNSKHDANAISQVVKFCKEQGYGVIPPSTVDRKPKIVRKHLSSR